MFAKIFAEGVIPLLIMILVMRERKIAFHCTPTHINGKRVPVV